MTDLHEAFTALAERHPATEVAEGAVRRRATRRRHRRMVLTGGSVVAVVAAVAVVALAWLPGSTTQLDVSGTVPTPATNHSAQSTASLAPTSTAFAPDDLRSVLPSSNSPVHVQVSGMAIVQGGGPVQLCTGTMYATRPPGCQGPVLTGVTVADLRALPGVEEVDVRGGVVWADVFVRGWFDGATVTPDDLPRAPAPNEQTSVSYQSGGPNGPSISAEQQQAATNDLLDAGFLSLYSTGDPSTGGMSIAILWADQALVDLLAARHPGLAITLVSAMAPV